MVKKTLTLVMITLSLSSFAEGQGDYSEAERQVAAGIFNASQEAIKAGKERLSSGYIEQLSQKNKKIQSDVFNIDIQDGGFNEVGEQLSYQDSITYKILVSSAMGDDELKRLFQSFSHRKDVKFVIRGLLPSEKTINDVSRRIFNLVRDFDVSPLVYLDPKPFEDTGVLLAPTIIAYQGKEVVNFAVGLTNSNYLREQMEVGNVGDLGRFGNTVKVTERDIIEVLKGRAEKIDRQKMVQDAKDGYWSKAKYIELPDAKETKRRIVEPVITIHEDITTSDGEFIAFAGTQINTLEKVPFSMRLVLFDATNPDHLEFVKALPKSRLRTKLITTKFDSSLEWDAVKAVEKVVNAPVYKLNRDVLTAFDLRVVPSIVTADHENNVFNVDEYLVTPAVTNQSEGTVYE